MSEERNRKFIKDIFIYGLGNISAKLVTFAIFPLYTFYILPDSLGYFNLVFATILLLMPLVNLQLREGIFRFLIDNRDAESRSQVISQSFRMIAIAMLVAAALFVPLSILIKIRCSYYIFLLLLTMGLHEVYTQTVRGLGHTGLFVVCGIITSFMILLFSILFVTVLRWDIEGVFLTNILARLAVIGFIELKLSVIRNHLKIKTAGKQLARQLLRYSLPLIVTSTALWMIINSNNYFIKHFLGWEANGLFAVAFRFAVVIDTLSSVIFQAWQETSVLQVDARDRDKYYSSMINSYLLLLTALVITLSLALKICYPLIVESKYLVSIRYVYPLGLAQIWFALMYFLTAIFQAGKNTLKILYITVPCAAASLVINYFLITGYGLTGVATAYGLSAFILFVSYYLSIRKTMNITLDYPRLIMFAVILTLGGTVFYNTDNILYITAFWLSAMTSLYLVLPKRMKKFSIH
ncbi:MAG: oligosaccharide flippase family protein [Tannerella sp.]|jgi:O-antigen/teichoic acid export membrane protein|nr:oligosaccharide flippase family protein [Tannerella sp.]